MGQHTERMKQREHVHDTGVFASARSSRLPVLPCVLVGVCCVLAPLSLSSLSPLRPFAFGSPNPGYLTVQIAKGVDPAEPDFSYQFGSVVPDWNAMDEVAFANITVAGQMPPFACDACVLRLTYSSNNPGENDTSTNFYQCADIVIEGGLQEAEMTLFPEARESAAAAPATADDSGCCTVPQWESQYYVAGGVPFSGAGNIHYDAQNRLIMSATQIGSGDSPSWEGHFTNFSSGIEWRYRNVAGVESCSAYGVDEWNDWCYGSTQNEAFTESITIGGQAVNVYANLVSDWSWGVAQSQGQPSQCIPVFRQHGESAILQEYFNVTEGIADPSVFFAPSACHLHAKHAWEMQQGEDLEAVRAFAKTLPRASTAAKTHMIPAGAPATKHKKHLHASQHEQKQHAAHKNHHSGSAQTKKPIAHPQVKKHGGK